MSVFGRMWRALVDLDAGQRQALMTWGLLGGIVAQSAVIVLLIARIDASAAIAPSLVVSGLVNIAYAMIGLQVLLGFGVVAIARGGTLMLNVTREGATIEARASGKAAQEMAKDGFSGTGG